MYNIKIDLSKEIIKPRKNYLLALNSKILGNNILSGYYLFQLFLILQLNTSEENKWLSLRMIHWFVFLFKFPIEITVDYLLFPSHSDVELQIYKVSSQQ